MTRDREMIAKVAKARFMDRSESVSAEGFVGTNLHQFKHVAKRVKSAESDESLPKAFVPHGFVIGLCSVDKDSSGKIWLVEPEWRSGEPEKWEVLGRVRMPGAGTVGPYVAIALVALLDGVPRIVQAYVHPAYSLDDLTLVDSDLERQTLTILSELVVRASAQGRDMSLVKPYFDLAHASEHVRPDFTVKSGMRSLYVETMGYTDDDYRKRKAKMHALMKAMHDVAEHTPGENDSDLRRVLSEFVGLS